MLGLQGGGDMSGPVREPPGRAEQGKETHDPCAPVPLQSRGLDLVVIWCRSEWALKGETTFLLR